MKEFEQFLDDLQVETKKEYARLMNDDAGNFDIKSSYRYSEIQRTLARLQVLLEVKSKFKEHYAQETNIL